MKKTRKNMLRSSAAMLLVSALALTTATYAWFTKGDSGSVGEFYLTAESANGIELSADAETWYSTLPWDQITGVTDSSKVIPSTSDKITPVSTSASALDNNGNLKLYAVSVDQTTNLVTINQVAAGISSNVANCIKFNFYVKNEGNTDLNFELNLADSTAATTKSTTIDTTAKAVRVAFINQGSVVIGTINDNGTTYIDSVKSVKTSSTANVKIWEPNPTKATTSTYVTTKAINGELVPANTETESGSVTKKNVMLSDNVVTEGAVLVDQTTSKGTTGTTTLATLKANTITKMTVYVWLEGQDADCTNQAAAGSVTFNLKFKAEAPTS
jgi:hypothetical protein